MRKDSVPNKSKHMYTFTFNYINTVILRIFRLLGARFDYTD